LPPGLAQGRAATFFFGRLTRLWSVMVVLGTTIHEYRHGQKKALEYASDRFIAC
jgi:hypothetical protein